MWGLITTGSGFKHSSTACGNQFASFHKNATRMKTCLPLKWLGSLLSPLSDKQECMGGLFTCEQ